MDTFLSSWEPLCRVGVKIVRISERNFELIPIFKVICQSRKHVHRFYRVYATRRVISPISPCYLVRPGRVISPISPCWLVRPGEDKQINLWDQLDTFSKLGYLLLEMSNYLLSLHVNFAARKSFLKNVSESHWEWPFWASAILENMCIDFIECMRPGG